MSKASSQKNSSNGLIKFILSGVFLLAMFAVSSYVLFTQFKFISAYPSDPVEPSNRTLSFQGRLLDGSNQPIATATTVSFEIFDAVTGGNSIWGQNTCIVYPDSEGIFSARLGVNGTLGCTQSLDDVFTEHPEAWLEVTINGETLDPRQPVNAVAYALNAQTLQGMRPGNASVGIDMNQVVLTDGSGNINLGTTNAKLKGMSGSFTVEGTSLVMNSVAGDISLTSGGDINLDSTGDILFNDLTTDGLLYVTNSIGQLSSLAYGTTGQLLMTTGSGLTWTDVHDPVTLESNSLDYLTLTNQTISLGLIDLNSDITGTLSVAYGGTGNDTFSNDAIVVYSSSLDALLSSSYTIEDLLAAADYTATNGLTMNGQTISLGGNLTESTTISTDGNTLVVDGTMAVDGDLGVSGDTEVGGTLTADNADYSNSSSFRMKEVDTTATITVDCKNNGELVLNKADSLVYVCESASIDRWVSITSAAAENNIVEIVPSNNFYSGHITTSVDSGYVAANKICKNDHGDEYFFCSNDDIIKYILDGKTIVGPDVSLWTYSGTWNDCTGFRSDSSSAAGTYWITEDFPAGFKNSMASAACNQFKKLACCK